MTNELRTTLEAWLLSDDPIQRRHAEFRLALTSEQVQPETDADRAARLIAENPPQSTDKRCCGG